MPQHTPPPPWTPSRVAELNTEQQRAGTDALHCGTDRHEHVPLTATLTGWRCPLGCGYNPHTAPANMDLDTEPSHAASGFRTLTAAGRLTQTSPPASRGTHRSAHCGEECSEGHVYAGRCAMLAPVNPDDTPEIRLLAAEHLLAELRHLHTRGPGELRTPAGMLNADDVCRSCCVQWPCPTGRILATATTPRRSWSGGYFDAAGRPTDWHGNPLGYTEMTAAGWDHCDACRTWIQATRDNPHDCPTYAYTTPALQEQP